MAHEQPHEAAATAGVDSKGLHLRRHRLPLTALQGLERRNHTAGSGQIGTATIGTKLPPPRIPADDHAREYPQYDLCHHRGEKEADAGLLPVVLEHRPVDKATDDSRQKYYKRV